MLTIFLFISLVIFIRATAESPAIEGRIYSEEFASPGEIPYQVSIQHIHNAHHFCGGTILNAKWVISAAHCVVAKHHIHEKSDYALISPSDIIIIAGTTNKKYPGSVHQPIEIIIHEEYDELALGLPFNDIALVKVDNEFIEGPFLKFVNLPNQGEHFPAGTVAVTSGWGRTYYERSPIDLRKTQLVIGNQQHCWSTANIFLHEYMHINHINDEINARDPQICAYDPSRMSSTCQGDSGGPLIVNHTLIGITSYGAPNCLDENMNNGFTRVSLFVDWIKDNAI